ncbi:hypothetical protein AK88_01645 [Plasmodium fragile]|uniref:SPX domain-containing protein n=1 Tax=Plasmodium fragile TaxID=5857 RepID=A0A0D9QNZ0_PLAFR|nr:uncharacterized protein AK88_01645 [Plasmodium fragile]KJP88764.1 hypothetical protein AK88_01645 [Plasmodium fragile]
MKFSKKLQERAHPKYREHYIAYKELKKAIRLITGKDTSTFTIKEVTTNFGGTRALSGTEYQSAESRFQSILNSELNKINNFTKQMIKEWYDDAHMCLQKLKKKKKKKNSLVDLSQVMNKLNELGKFLKFLESYRILNFTGFRKITKKFDKHNDKVVSSSFYITVVIKSFFMSCDMNLLVCILSLCYKHYRACRNLGCGQDDTGDNVEGESTHHGLPTTTTQALSPRPPEEHPHSDVHGAATSTSNLEEKKKKNENVFSHGGNATPAAPNESVHPAVHTEKKQNPRQVIKNTKYIVKAQDLITVKVEICKYYTFHYYDLKENELMPPFESFIKLISTSKIRNDLTTIYFDDASFTQYHKYVNRSCEQGDSTSHCVRLRYYCYIDAEKESTKTVIQNFNLFEPSCDVNEKYVFAKDVPQENLTIGCVNDLYNLKKGDASGNSHSSFQGADSTQLQHYEKCISEIEKNHLTSCLKSKLNRIHFGDENVSGYIDENICYWVHTNKGAIHKCEEVDSLEADHSELDEPNRVKQHNDIVSESGNREEEPTTKEKRKYAYFDYAVVDVTLKELSSRDFSFQLNHLGVVKEIWGYSSYLQGISMLYSHRISTAPHWRIYTHPEWDKLNKGETSIRGMNKKKQRNKKKEKKTKKEDEGVELGKNTSEEKERENKKSSSGSRSSRSETLNQDKESNQSILSGEEEEEDDEEEEEEDKNTELSSSENTIEYTEGRVENNRNGKNEEWKKGITYTGASARIAHESEVIFRNEVERNKPISSAHHFHVNIDNVDNADYCTNRGSYIGPPYSGDSSNNLRKKSNQKDKQCTIRHPLAEDNNLYEPLLDPMEETTSSKGNISSSCGITSFFKKIFFCKNKTVDIKKPKTAVVRVEPKTFFANERTLLQWLNTSVLLSTISITLLNFSNSYGFASGVIMAPVAIFFILYSFHIYLKRAEALTNKEPINYTDKVGPGVLVITLTFALSTVVILNMYSRLKGEV